ncbi:MAG: hypothetical protein SPL69_03565 [Succinivibrionaceae bacterium]|nr:hypothetical protein [Succinivibrionaceae bacterium]
MKKLITAIAAALLVPSFGAMAGGIPVFDGAAKADRDMYHLADRIFTETNDLAARAQESVNEINNTIQQTTRMIDNAEQQFKTTIQNTTGMFSDVFDDIIKKNTEKMKASIESSSKELTSAFNYGAKAVVQSVSKEKIMAWWKASGAEEKCGGDGTEAKATKYEKYCAALTMADATYAAKIEEYQDGIRQDMVTLDSIRQQLASNKGMTQKQMQDATVTLATVGAQIELRKQAMEALKNEYEAKREMAENNADRALRREPSPAELQEKFKKGLSF